MSALEIHSHFTQATFYEDKVDADLPALRLKQYHAEFGIISQFTHAACWTAKLQNIVEYSVAVDFKDPTNQQKRSNREDEHKWTSY